jgi:Dolichyl-phosphate-mannose-protein mannosyltransferase
LFAASVATWNFAFCADLIDSFVTGKLMARHNPNEHSGQHRSLWPWVHLIALGYFALHLATSTRYGYFRDALYYLACSEHLSFGYVDQPPLIAILAWIARHTLGTSLPALIFWPALSGAARIILTAALTRELGARRFGVVLAAALAATPSVWWVIDHQFAMNTFEALLWTGCAYVIVRLIKTRSSKLWLVFGVLAGVGLENKYSIAIFVFALLVGVLLTKQRNILFTPWILAGGGVALLIFLPNLIWNIAHNWPFLELIHNVRATGKDVVLPPAKYLLQQGLMMNPMSFPFWFGGLLYYLLSREGRTFRALGWTFLITIGFFLLNGAKDYYTAPSYPMLFAAGAVVTEGFLTSPRFISSPKSAAVLKAACFIWLFAGVALLLPLVLPVLSIEKFLRYQAHLPFEVPKTERSFEAAVLPQYYADEFPWPGMVYSVARVYHSLTPEEQAKTAIFCQNYGQAAAIDFFGPRYGLPKAISGHQNYFLWGPRNYTGEIVIVVGDDEEGARDDFRSVEVAATQSNKYAFWYETQPILLCRGLKWDLQTGWPKVKNWR